MSDPCAYGLGCPAGGEGLHHVALIIDGFAAEHVRSAGDGMARHGHFIKLYERRSVVTGFYDFIARAACRFDRRDPARNTNTEELVP